MPHSNHKSKSSDLYSIQQTAKRLASIVSKTPLTESVRYSNIYACKLLLKREDTQVIRSYKIRGAFNKINSLSKQEKTQGVVCASAGNHAQGVAYSCRKLAVRGTIYMPLPTPKQKIDQVKMFGGDLIDVIQTGDTYDDAQAKAIEKSKREGLVFVHPFDDEKIIEGQATIGLELIEQQPSIDYLFVPIGGGGLVSGLLKVFKRLSPQTTVIGVEPEGAASMSAALSKGEVVSLNKIDSFVDGAAVKRVGELNFKICNAQLDHLVSVPEGQICQTILDLYNKDAIVAEPAGALAISALDQFREEINGKTVVCILSGSNNDMIRTAEIKERALLHARLKHYFIVRFPQRTGALKEFVNEILGPNDDITHFQYAKKHHREIGPAVVGIQLKNPKDLTPLVKRMKVRQFFGEYLNDKPDLFQFLI